MPEPGIPATRSRALADRWYLATIGASAIAVVAAIFAGLALVAEIREDARGMRSAIELLETSSGPILLWDRARDRWNAGANSIEMRDVLSAVEERIAAMRRLTGDSDIQSRHLDTMSAALRDAFSGAHRDAEAVHAQRARFSDALIALRREELRQLREHQANSSVNAARALAASFAGIGLAAAGAIGAAFVARRYRRRREQADARLREREEWFRKFAEAVPGLMTYMEPDTTIVYHNRAYRDALGLPFEKIHGRQAREVLDARAWELSRPWLDRALAGETVRFERVHHRPDGSTFFLDCNYVPNRDVAGRVTGVYGLHVDVTQHRELERLKDEFISVTGHELRTPLTSIAGAFTLLEDGVGGRLPERAARLVATARRNTERLARLVDDLTVLQRLDAGDLQMHLAQVPVQASLDAAAKAFAEAARSRELRLVAERVPEPGANVYCDADKLSRILSHLASNACKYARRGTGVELSAQVGPERVRFHVRNEGAGIPEALRPRIFERFSLARSAAGGGTGLGLAICKELVEQMGGTIAYSSTPGGLTEFYFDLPRSPLP